MSKQSTELKSKIESESENNLRKFQEEINKAVNELAQFETVTTIIPDANEKPGNMIVIKTDKSINKFVKNTTGIISSFLRMQELGRFFITSKQIHNNLKSAVDKKVKKASELLSIVLNEPSCKKVQEWIENNKSDDSIGLSLIKTNGEEGYFSKIGKQMICNRVWENISPLQAAACSGDHFVLIKFLFYILKEEIRTKDSTNRLNAAKQLQEIIETYKYLISFKSLLEAYEFYISYRETVLENVKWDDIDNNMWDQFHRYWENVCRFQKRLSRYGLQEFCDTYTTFCPIPTFKSEPDRGELYVRFFKNPLNLDMLGQSWTKSLDLHGENKVTIFLGLLKGSSYCASLEEEFSMAKQDFDALKSLCNRRESEIKNIIKALFEGYENADVFVKDFLSQEETNRENQKKNIASKI